MGVDRDQTWGVRGQGEAKAQLGLGWLRGVIAEEADSRLLIRFFSGFGL